MPDRATTRLAPSPTGALHLGNARTFLINWALARKSGWRIILRIEDLDGPRVKPGVIEATIDTIKWLGMDWDEGPHIQSGDLEPYRAAMRTLSRNALAYPCDLTRTQIESAASAPQEGSHEVPFPASLRPTVHSRDFENEETNWRFATPSGPVEFADGFAGPQRRAPAESVGDFILWTKRAQPSYQLAVVVDDARQGVTHIVRGDDLLDSAARQLLLYRALALTPVPAYIHLPLVRGEDGRRLAKRHGDTRIDTYRAAGVSADRLVALMGHWCGFSERPGRLPVQEFMNRLDLATIPRNDITFTPEDHRWLLAH